MTNDVTVTEEQRVLLRRGEWPWPVEGTDNDGHAVLRPVKPIRISVAVSVREQVGGHYRDGKRSISGVPDEIRKLRDALTAMLEQSEAAMTDLRQRKGAVRLMEMTAVAKLHVSDRIEPEATVHFYGANAREQAAKIAKRFNEIANVGGSDVEAVVVPSRKEDAVASS